MKKNLNIKSSLIVVVTIWLTFAVVPPAVADNAVKLRLLVIATGAVAEDLGLAYIKPVLEEMGVPYDVLNAATHDLTPAALASSVAGANCKAEDAGCVGNYNGIILTDADLVPSFTPSEWDILHDYQKNFRVRQAVLSGWPATYSDAEAPYGVYLDYGLVYSSKGDDYEAQWTVPAVYTNEVFEYVNRSNPLTITGFAFATRPRNDPGRLRDGSVPNVEPILITQNGETLLSIVRYMVPSQPMPVREVMISTITNADFLLHSKVLAYEFVNWAAQGVFVGGRYVHLAAHVDDLFLPDHLWDPALKMTNTANTYRVNKADIDNAVRKQFTFRAAHPLAGNFKLDFPFNGAGAVVDPKAATLTLNLKDELVAAVADYKASFRFINHTFTHQEMNKAPVPADAPCDYATFTTVAPIEGEITRNRAVWGLLGLPERDQNNRVLISGAHSGLRDRRCTDNPALHATMFDVRDDDVAFDQGGANPLFLKAAANVGVKYLASDAWQRAQDVEQYISQYDDGSPDDRLMLPRWPTNIFYNVIKPSQLQDEYNYVLYQKFLNAGKNPCGMFRGICAQRNYKEILLAEADMALRHMLTFKKWPHFFHQSNLAKYDERGNTLLFDWLNAVFTEYERLLTLPVKNLPYYLIGDQTAASLKAKSATIHAIWNRANNEVTLSADRAIPDLLVTGVSGGNLYGGQFIREVAVDDVARAFTVDRALTQ
ncbi:hypothetical protein SAMN05216299_13220 [Nitrosospira sp. Nsp14]|uniref:Agd3-related carbohydrate deacetylase n=1 Tax=Nitrosospira sp. Nsp14 TaxID=1855333 RepID=UPI0008F289C3|nr:hypothetical protein [Nitrosospira sp. Nsp14]SFH60492.1 hypothetical protein SAMN05216299_13220 [Nitrosospira sp. Nsp14]